MKRIITVISALILMLAAFSFTVCAEGTEQIPALQHKLINHDRIALRWTKVDGAEGYYIYREDPGTGGKYKYPTAVKGTSVVIKDLEPSTDYIFRVAAVKNENGGTVVGQKSNGTALTTPRRWYIYKEYEGRDKHSVFYRKDYANTVKEKIDLGKASSSVHEVVWYDGYYYFFKDKNSSVPTGEYSFCRIKEDGTEYKVLAGDLSDAEGFGYNYKIYKDGIYYEKYSYEQSGGGGFYMYGDSLYRISAETGKAKKLRDILCIDSFVASGDYIYFVYDECAENKDISPAHGNAAYKYTGNSYLARIKNDGSGDIEIICDFPEKLNGYGLIYVNNGIFYFQHYEQKKLDIKMLDLESMKITGVTSRYSHYCRDIKVKNGYIYFTDYSSEEDAYYRREPLSYRRIKCDGTGLSARVTPFEWIY